ncbi:glycine cleavage system H protein [Paralysiella testudinis]|uniref:Glycine cleavage system H protein n=1 Tax=Paralysiella testudinis TaxID=2809020 RepID=A0A892ZGR6_9NEIS|nr:glycine cleavage system H protein [Paralysiella testudinis]QRQ81833.1 glycine cleavage system H protein [Paralysiella testudinis]
MSIPSELFVRRENGDLVQVFLGSKATAAALFDYLLHHLPDVAPDYAEEFEYSNWDVLSITGLSAAYFMPVYDLIMQACQELELVKPYQAALQAALQSDPRYRQQQAA